MNKDKIAKEVSASAWFAGIEQNKADRLVACSHVRNYAPDEFVYLVGDVQTHLFLILDGRVKVSIVSQEGDEFVLTMWEAGSWFGEGALLEGATMPLEARAVNSVTVLAVPIASIDKVLDTGVNFYRSILKDMIRRANQLYTLVEMLLFKPLRVRVVARMLHLIELFGQEVKDGIVLPLQFSQSDFARMSGGSRQRINKIFRQWANDGIVTKKGRHYIVHDIDALRAALQINEDD